MSSIKTTEKSVLSVLVVGFGRMGKRHAAAYQALQEFDLVGVCGREHQRSDAESNYPKASYYLDAQTAIESTNAEVVCIATHIDSHESLARAAIDSGAHVFLEKPVAQTLAETEALFAYANDRGKKIIVGYVRKHDPLWRAFVDKSKQLGSPVVVRFLLDQPSAGDEWQVHRSILKNSSLTFDCAVHYVDMMANICGAKPVRVTGRAVRLHADPSLNGNYGYLSVEFSDGSIGSFDSAWGPMVGEKSSSVITATGPVGSVSIVRVAKSTDDTPEFNNAVVYEAAVTSESDVRHSEVIQIENVSDKTKKDAFVLQQQYLYDCIANDTCMVSHFDDVIMSMLIVAAADESVATRDVVEL